MFTDCAYDATGNVVCTYRGLPFQCTENETPAEWLMLQAAIDAGEVSVAAYSPPLEVPPVPFTREEIEAMRLQAYADPIQGCDRYFSEAARMQVMGEDGWEAQRALGIARFEEIQALYPWPPEAAANNE